MNSYLPYDKSSPISIENYAKQLIGKTFRQITLSGTSIQEESEPYGIELNKNTKGGLGQLLEKYYFMYDLNNDSGPDFKEAGVELKTTGYKINSKKKISAKERLVLNIINYMEIHKEDFENSSFFNKNKLLLIIFYLYEKEFDRLDFVINYAQLFQFPNNDLKIIKDDWETIVNKIKEGKAHEISEGDTNYLGACTKGASAESVRDQPFCDIKAKQRAFSLKPSYLTHILNEYIIKGQKTYDDSIIKDINELKNTTFEKFVLDKIKKHSGKTITELADEFEISSNSSNKSFTFEVAKGLLGVKGNCIEEIEKANIKVKTIRIEQNGKIKEHMSFPTFKFTEIINEEWETSTLRELFLDTRYLFIIYRFDENRKLRLDRGMFWNVPYSDLENDIRKVWELTVETIKHGVKIIKKIGNREFNNLPNASDNRVAHVRPHAQNKKDTYPLPTGGEFPKQCFWLNNSYIQDQINRNS